MKLKKNHDGIDVYTDGSCIRNPGPAGSTCLIIDRATKKVTAISKNIGERSTNNKAELTAIIFALEHIKWERQADRVVQLFSDSQYALNLLSGKHKPKANKFLVRTMVGLRKNFTHLGLFWVRGHSNNEWNEYCDELSRFAAHNPDYDHLGEYTVDSFRTHMKPEV